MVYDKVVLITGSGKGIGRYMARSFARNGAKVVVNDIAPLDNVTREVKEEGAEVLAIENPVLALGIVGLGHQCRAIFCFGGIEIIPDLLVLHHMRVRIDHVRFYIGR